ncbi:MAG: hypothetical protein D6729_14960 [Deltaproteobacteria bacterium]|nr:MAG: hypothetical protein D6729_14960 [Deltaproteobacteria bacterium]
MLVALVLLALSLLLPARAAGPGEPRETPKLAERASRARLERISEAPRVRAARARVGQALRSRFERAGIGYPPELLFIRIFKADDVLELWAGRKGEPLRLVQRYPICARSGSLGPKRRQGDLQVPEGIYRIDRLNPWSSYHLSLGIDYPNRSDRIRGTRPLGGDIFIHGDCVTIGCVPLTDQKIEALFLAVLDARLAGLREVPVHLFPTHLDAAGMARLRALPQARRHLAFWEELRPIYEAFERTRRIPRVRIDPTTGAYRLEAASSP